MYLEPDVDRAYDRAVARLDALVNDLAQPLPYVPSRPPAEQPVDLPAVQSTMPGAMYQDAVEVAREYNLAGAIFQVVLPGESGSVALSHSKCSRP